MRIRGLVVVGAGVVASVALVLSSTTAVAAGTIGVDVAAPQCGSALPASPSFAIVGVNAGVANTTNPCLATQLAWANSAAGGTKQPLVALYVNTANPELGGAWWPDSNTTQGSSTSSARTPSAVANPYGACAHDATDACAFVYGYSMAKDDATIRGVPNPAAQTWWLDVETANTWQADQAENRASLEGMTSYFASIGGKVGVYAAPSHWSEVAGTVPRTSLLAKLPSWRALGPVSHASAVRACAKPSYTPLGRLSITQYVSAGTDYNVSCGRFTTAPTPKIHGTPRVGAKLMVATRSWKPTVVKLGYRWYRDGKAIVHATHSSYVLTRADAGHRITVMVTGKKTGYSTLAKTSAAKRVKK